jgi:hypothetical protein
VSLACGQSRRDAAGDEPRDARSNLEWTYGTPTRSVLSSPISDGERVFVLVGDRAEPKPMPNASDFGGPVGEDDYAVTTLSLVALDRSGGELWSRELCTRPHYLGGPALLPDASVVAACDDSVVRLGRDGGEIARAAPGAPVDGNTAVALDGGVVFLSRRFTQSLTDEGRAFQANAALVYLNPDLSLRWQRAIGFTTGSDLPAFTRLSPHSGPVVDAAGNAYGPCDTCTARPGAPPRDAADRAIYARFSAATGDVTELYPVGIVPTTFGMSALESDGALWFTVNGTLVSYRAASGGLVLAHVLDDAFLLAPEGPVLPAEAGPRARGDAFTLLASGVGVGDDGARLFDFPDLDPDTAPIVLPDQVLGPTIDQRLRALVVAGGEALGPWPFLAGDPGGTRRAH